MGRLQKSQVNGFKDGRMLISQLESSIATGQNTGRLNPLSLEGDSIKSEGSVAENPEIQENS